MKTLTRASEPTTNVLSQELINGYFQRVGTNPTIDETGCHIYSKKGNCLTIQKHGDILRLFTSIDVELDKIEFSRLAAQYAMVATDVTKVFIDESDDDPMVVFSFEVMCTSYSQFESNVRKYNNGLMKTMIEYASALKDMTDILAGNSNLN